MILEEATYEAFGYYPSDFAPRSYKLIIAACDRCGKVRIAPKHDYCAFCRSCALSTEERKAKISTATKGENNHMWKGGKNYAGRDVLRSTNAT